MFLGTKYQGTGKGCADANEGKRRRAPAEGWKARKKSMSWLGQMKACVRLRAVAASRAGEKITSRTMRLGSILGSLMRAQISWMRERYSGPVHSAVCYSIVFRTLLSPRKPGW